MLRPRRAVASTALAMALLAGCAGHRNDKAPPTADCGAPRIGSLASVVYVSPQGTDGPACGTTTAAACATIQQGIDRCAATGCGVLVRHGRFATGATIHLRDAVDVYGSCRFDGEVDRRYRTVVDASPAPGTPAIDAVGVHTATRLHRLVVVGKDETAGGAASITLAARQSTGLTLAASVLVGGKGGGGTAGAARPPASPGGNGSAAPGGFTAGPGGAACSGGDAGPGGRGAASNVLYTVHHAGFLWTTCRNDNPAGTGPNGQSGGNAGPVQGGAGGTTGTAGCFCDNQVARQAGNAPQAAAGREGICSATGGSADPGAVWGRFAGMTWIGGQGGSGGVGAGGSGGGGGGGGGYSASTNDNSGDYSGYAGGGGGGGGCGGGTGPGGQQGGASMVVVLATSIVTGDGSALIPGPGGPGGDGATGGAGGGGGLGMPGWPGGDRRQRSCNDASGNPLPAPGSGGLGGNGGPGGAGGGGAAGNGGPSVGIALVASSPMPQVTSGIYAPLPGLSGTQGAGGRNPASATNPQPCKAADGGAGSAGGGRPVVDFDRIGDSASSPGSRP